MIAELLTVLSISPWSLTTGGYYAQGRYSSDAVYSSRSIYVGVDNKDSDLLGFSVDQSRITSDYVSYRQNSVLARTSHDLNGKIRAGLLAGWLNSNDLDGGQILGFRVDGELPWFWYSVLHHYGEWELPEAVTGDAVRTRIRQSEVDLWHYWRYAWGGARLAVTHPDGRDLVFVSAEGGFTIFSRIGLKAGYGFGQGYFLTDWNSLTIDNSRDEVQRQFNASLFIVPLDWMTWNVGYLKKSYRQKSSTDGDIDYSLGLWVGGVTFTL